MEKVKVAEISPFGARDKTVKEFALAQRQVVTGQKIQMPPGLNPLQKISFVGKVTQELKNGVTEAQFAQFKELGKEKKNVTLKQHPESEYI